MSETIPEDEDRGGDGAIAGAVGDEPGATTDDDSTDDETERGTGADDGGPGSQNM